MRTALTIGNFDGVHLGHQALIASINAFKNQPANRGEQIKTLVLSFEPHPIEVLKPGTFVKRLTPLAKKIELLKSLGVDEVRVLPFTKEFAQTSALDFFEQTILKDCHPAYLVVGPNFYFGHNRQGTPEKLISWCNSKGVQAEILKRVEQAGETVSSTRIRQLVEEGNVRVAAQLLGRSFSIAGEIAHGNKKGRLLEFPTTNIVPQVSGIGALCLPARGVYLTRSTIEGKIADSVTNVGVKPTVTNEGILTVETHILNYAQTFHGEVYGKVMSVEFQDRLRGEQKFANLDELKAQIQKDTELARSLLRNR